MSTLAHPRKVKGKEGRGRRKRNVKILPSFCHALRTGLVNCCQIKKTERKTAVVALYKKTLSLAAKSGESPQTELHSYF